MTARLGKTILFISGGIIFSVIILFFIAYKTLWGENIKLKDRSITIYIPTGSTYQQVLDTIYTRLDIKNKALFEWISLRKSYPRFIKPGKYVLERNVSYIGLINLLRSGRQTPVRVTFNNIRTLEALAGKIGKYIEADSVQILEFLKHPENFKADGFNEENIISVFIPDTYEFFWNTSAQGFYTRMLQEYRNFWNEDRMKKAKEKGLDPHQVSILASIIDDEVTKKEEKKVIAGVYLNRLERGIPLQACPTIKFVLNDFTITRVLKKYLIIDSPYNTYKYRGFPPGPIGCPSVEGIDAVLNAQEHNFLYFAARADFSGYHNFSTTLAEHNRYAAEYQRELDRRKIFR